MTGKVLIARQPLLKKNVNELFVRPVAQLISIISSANYHRKTKDNTENEYEGRGGEYAGCCEWCCGKYTTTLYCTCYYLRFKTQTGMAERSRALYRPPLTLPLKREPVSRYIRAAACCSRTVFFSLSNLTLLLLCRAVLWVNQTFRFS